MPQPVRSRRRAGLTSVSAGVARAQQLRRSVQADNHQALTLARPGPQSCVRGDMGMLRWVTAVAVLLVTCATPYQQYGVLRGLDAKELRPDVFRVSFQGNGFTSKESVQVYWLNRCAELAIEK